LKSFQNQLNFEKISKFEIKKIFLLIIKYFFFALIKFYKKIIFKISSFSNFNMIFTNLFYLNKFQLLLNILNLKYQKICNFLKIIKINFINKFLRLINKLFIYLINFNSFLINKILHPKLITFLFDNQIFNIYRINNQNKFLFLFESKFGLNLLLNNILKLYKIIFLNKIFLKFFFNKFKLYSKTFSFKLFKKFIRFSDYLKYTKTFFLKNYNFLLLSLLIKIKIDLKHYFYYILYKYNYKDQKIFFDLYNYIYKVYNKNNVLNQLKFLNFKKYKNFNFNWNYKNFVLNYNFIKASNSKTKFKLLFSFYLKFFIKKKKFLFNNITATTKNILHLNHYKDLNFLFYKINFFYQIKALKSKNNFFRKFKTLKYSGLVFNKNKFANLFLLNTKPEYFNVLNLRKKLFFNNCLNK
jgi:hypothetical protein